jgi:hypothetical protein
MFLTNEVRDSESYQAFADDWKESGWRNVGLDAEGWRVVCPSVTNAYPSAQIKGPGEIDILNCSQ